MVELFATPPDSNDTDSLIQRNLTETKPKRNRWEKTWQHYAAQIQAGLCTCRRHLVNGLCNPAEGGCGKPPLPLTPRAGKRCWCIPIPKNAEVAAQTPDGAMVQWATSNPELATVVNAGVSQVVHWTRAIQIPANKLPLPIKLYRAQSAENMHCTILAYGDPGSGKSYSMMRQLELTDPTFNLSRVIYTKRELLYWTWPGRLHKGQALLIDEGGPLMSNKRSLSQMNQFLSELFQTFRQDCAVVAVCVPRTRYIELAVRELVQFHVHAVGVDKLRGASVTDILRIQHMRGGVAGEDVMRYVPLCPGAPRRYGWSLPRRIPLAEYEAKKLQARQVNHSLWVSKFSKADRAVVNEGAGDGDE